MSDSDNLISEDVKDGIVNPWSQPPEKTIKIPDFVDDNEESPQLSDSSKTPSPPAYGSQAYCTPVMMHSDHEVYAALTSRQLLIRILDNQKDMSQRIQNIENCLRSNSNSNIPKKTEKIEIPVGLKKAVRKGFMEGQKKGLKWHFDGKRLNDSENANMNYYISNFVRNWIPSFNDVSILNAALERYFITKKQEKHYAYSDKLDAEKKRRATYERKKEKSKRRRTALESLNIDDGSKTQIRNVMIPILMSSDEECEGGFITHQPSWQSEQFKNYKQLLDSKYKETCSKRSRSMLQTRTIGEFRQVAEPDLLDDQKWILKS